MRILVTGGAGYIGSHACKLLAAAGYEPVVFDDFSNGHREFVRWGPLVDGSLLDPAALDAAFARHQPQAVMHFAALAEVGASVRDPESYYRTNVGGSLNLLSAMRRANVMQLVFSSTCAIFGTPEVLPLAEDAPKQPVNPYGQTKLVVEGMLEDFERAYGLRSVALRYFNACGADLAAEIGERHLPESHLIPRAILAAQGKAPPLQVFGNDYPTPDGSAVRDYIHVLDLAQAHLDALRWLGAGGVSERFNIGTGTGYSVLEVIRAIESESGLHVPCELAPRRIGDPPTLVADPARAQRSLGVKTRYSDLPTIINSAWRWHLKE